MNAVEICQRRMAGMALAQQDAPTRGHAIDQIAKDHVDHRKTALTFVQAKPELFRADFAEWLHDNHHVWTAFECEANRLWGRGRRHYSARTILHWIRHETALRESPTSDVFKINNNWSPDLSRLYACYYPERADFFENRARTAEGTHE
jgi:hypothetical protein